MTALCTQSLFANYDEGIRPFHQTPKRDFLQAMDISCFSFISIANHFKTLLSRQASLVTISISTTRMAAENLRLHGPGQGSALNPHFVFFGQKFFRLLRGPLQRGIARGLLKTSASAGIPGYIDSYLYAEQATLRKKGGCKPKKPLIVATFLLSPRSSGMTGQCLVVDAGMGINYFDHHIVNSVAR